MENHNFWKSQPIQNTLNKIKINESSDVTTLNDDMFPKDPYKLLDNYMWYTLNPENQDDLSDLQLFLYENYNDNGDNFGLSYSKDLLYWFMNKPNVFKDMFFCVKYNNKIVGSILVVPITVSIFDKISTVFETSFLCINKKIRHKNLASILIKEALRRMYHNGHSYGYYTTHLKLPNSLTSTKFYHKPINVKKLFDIKFLPKSNNISFSSYEKIYKINDKLKSNMRKMKESDLEICCNKLNEFNKKFKIYQIFTLEEFKHKYFYSDKIVDSYIVEKNNIITDFISVCYIKSRVFNNDKYTEYSIGQIYNYFYENSLIDLISDVSYFMKENNIDVLNCLNQMDNHLFIDKLNFKEGTGELHFYFWNKICPQITSKDISIITI